MGKVHEMVMAKQFDEEFQQIQKMEVVGRLAGGVAHDFNNLLTIILGCSDLLLNHPTLNDEARELVGDIRKAGDQATLLTRQLLAFSRKQPLQAVILDLNGVVTNLGRMLHRLIGENIKLTTVLEPALHPVQADPGQLEQVLMNLVVNSRDAMPRGGQLTLQTANVVIGEAQARPSEVQPGDYATLEVTDSGHGMNRETMARLFQPFFTTKPPGKGTGLGLAFSYGIVKQYGGHIQVTSQPGHGSTFKIFFPKVIQALSPSKMNGQRPTTPTGHETVLLVEDESAVRKLECQILQHSGYTVLEASNGLEALQVAKNHSGTINLVVTDVVMPLMSGPQLASHLVQQRPSLKVLYVSGYTDSTIALQGGQVHAALLMKPFTPDVLAFEVRRILER